MKTFLPWFLCFVLLGLLLWKPFENKGQLVNEVISFKMDAPDYVEEIEPEETEKKVEEFKALPEQKKVEVYSAAVVKREYKKTFKDKGDKIEVTAKTTGSLDSLKVDYTRKEKIHLYLGAEAGLLGSENPVIIKANLVSKNKIYSAGYDINTKSFLVGVTFKIF